MRIVPKHYQNKIEIELPYIPFGVLKRNPGTFGLLHHDKEVQDTWRHYNWIDCRETFQQRSKGIKRFLFYHRKNRGRHVAAFIEQVERKLGKRKFTTFGPTQWDSVIWVKPTAFWSMDDMRRSLFTILLRAGQSYNLTRDNFDAALYSNQYARLTKPAVEKFLKGYTQYKGFNIGWYSEFVGSFGLQRANNLLIKP